MNRPEPRGGDGGWWINEILQPGREGLHQGGRGRNECGGLGLRAGVEIILTDILS